MARERGWGVGAGGSVRENLKHGKGVTGLRELRTGSVKGKICDTFLSLNLSLPSNGNYLSFCVCVCGRGGFTFRSKYIFLF